MSHRLPVSLAFLFALALAGCGVKGPLEPPGTKPPTPPGQKAAAASTTTPNAAANGPVATAPQGSADNTRGLVTTDDIMSTNSSQPGSADARAASGDAYVAPNTPGDSVSRPVTQTPNIAKRPFILDGLL
ncbi:LPS translocon maturation chaperone LptM [Roseixanthobacter glucoisosaccharinicivorans]|uniref:LPS translocon maturation chaperone LptM n=1 Tax=Roseixanthobacter glucoisosaccharinicivorans TaxID=3119923 RepID=UPI00372BB99C